MYDGLVSIQGFYPRAEGPSNHRLNNMVTASSGSGINQKVSSLRCSLKSAYCYVSKRPLRLWTSCYATPPPHPSDPRSTDSRHEGDDQSARCNELQEAGPSEGKPSLEASPSRWGGG